MIMRLISAFCEAIIADSRADFCGLIGSETKALKFRQRLLKKGFSQKELEKLKCPVGLSALKSKKPMKIAVSITAQLLLYRDSIHERLLHS